MQLKPIVACFLPLVAVWAAPSPLMDRGTEPERAPASKVKHALDPVEPYLIKSRPIETGIKKVPHVNDHMEKRREYMGLTEGKSRTKNDTRFYLKHLYPPRHWLWHKDKEAPRTKNYSRELNVPPTKLADLLPRATLPPAQTKASEPILVSISKDQKPPTTPQATTAVRVPGPTRLPKPLLFQEKRRIECPTGNRIKLAKKYPNCPQEGESHEEWKARVKKSGRKSSFRGIIGGPGLGQLEKRKDCQVPEWAQKWAKTRDCKVKVVDVPPAQPENNRQGEQKIDDTAKSHSKHGPDS